MNHRSGTCTAASHEISTGNCLQHISFGVPSAWCCFALLCWFVTFLCAFDKSLPSSASFQSRGIQLRMRSSIIVSAVLLGLSYAKPTLNRRYTVKESHHVPSDFSRVGEAPGHHLMRLQVAVKQGQFEVLEKHLWESEFKTSTIMMQG